MWNAKQRYHNICRAHRTFDGCETLIPVFLERHHHLSVTENENSRISGIHEKYQSDAKPRFLP
jgi:hypothetical protein